MGPNRLIGLEREKAGPKGPDPQKECGHTSMALGLEREKAGP